MTIFGAAVHGCAGIVWTDTESYLEGEVYETTCAKLGIFPASGLVSFGAGRIFLGKAARSAAEGFASFDEALKKMPAVLSSASQGLADQCRAFNMDDDLNSTVCLVGFARGFKSLLVAEFSSATDYRYQFHRQVSSPEVDVDIDPLAHDWEVIDLARQQLDRFRLSMREATGGALMIARLMGETITVRRIPDFAISAGAGRATARAGTPAR